MPVNASTPFATLADVQNVGLPASALGALTMQQQQACLDDANAEVGGALAGRWPGINTNGGSGWTWDAEVVGWAVRIAQANMLDTRGRQPTAQTGDKAIDARCEHARKMIKMTQDQAHHPNIAGGEPAGQTSQGPNVYSVSASFTNSGATSPNRGITGGCP